MANRRMFSKNTTSSSRFLKMPSSSRLLWYDLGMNADDDGYVEWFSVMRLTGASEQDLDVLAVNGLVQVFDEMVLWITNWKENNYIRGDTYTKSRYAELYPIDSSTDRPRLVAIPSPQVRIGKDRIVKEREEKIITQLLPRNKRVLTPEDISDLSVTLNVTEDLVRETFASLLDYVESKGVKYADYKATVRNWIRRDIKAGKIKTRKPVKTFETEETWISKI